jgi:pimeloyl-ACP methyl ester carboxylesterase
MLRRAAAVTVDLAMCASMNFLQARHRLPAGTRKTMENYVEDCEKLTLSEFYACPLEAGLAGTFDDQYGRILTWPSPIRTSFPANDIARVDLFPCSRGWQAPTVLMLHALMSAGDVGYRKWAARFNSLGWNACFLHLPFHYSRVPAGCWNGELAITADLMRNAQGLRQSVIELRQVIAALRKVGGRQFGVLGTSYGGWIGALLAALEKDLCFVALMAPIVNVHHTLWESLAAVSMRRELRRARVEPALVARHFRLSSPIHMEPVTETKRILFVAGDYDLIARPKDVMAIHEKWSGSELLRVPQGHFGYRMMKETVARLEETYLKSDAEMAS